MKSFLTAVRLRLILLIAIVVIVIAAVVLMQFARGLLNTTAKEVSEASAEAVASQNEIDQLQRMERQLSENETAVERAASIVAESKSYQYQNQIVRDLNKFARQSGVSIVGIDFSTSTTGSSSSSPSTGTPSAAQPAPTAGLKAVSATITLDSPINYNNYLRFINAIEQNLTKMQLQRIGLSATDKGVTSEALTVQVYTK